MKLQPKTNTILRVISIFGIILLLSLQYIWLKNAYKALEQNLIDKSVECLKIAVDEELFYRQEKDGVKYKFEDSGKAQVKPQRKDFTINNIEDIQYLINVALFEKGVFVNLNYLDSVFRNKILNEFGYIPNYNVYLLKGKKINTSKKYFSTKKNFEVINNSNTIQIKYRVGFEHSILVVIHSPFLVMINKGKYVLLLSVLVVFLIVAILIFQFYNFKREAKFSNFIIDYTRMLTHDLMSPISSIRMLLNKLRTTKDIESSIAEKYYELSIDQSDKILFNLSSLLYLSASERRDIPVNRCSIDVGLLIQKVCERISRMNSEFKIIHLNVHQLPERFFFKMDMNLMENVLFNLLDNAVKYSNEIVNITIVCEKVKGFMILKIQDDGFGMSPSVQKKIFEVFDRGNVEGSLLSGYGIGLSFVKKVVNAHGGKVTVESKTKWGSVFTIELPE